MAAIHQLSGLVVRASALRLGGWGSIPGPGHTKDYKNGTQFLLAWCSASRVGLGCAATMWCERIHRLCAAWRHIAGLTPEPVDLSACLPPSLSPFPVHLPILSNKGKSPKNILSRCKLVNRLFQRKLKATITEY